MKKTTVFVCNECGGESVKWYGRCPSCGAWNTLVEEKVIKNSTSAQTQSGKKVISKPQSISNVCLAENPRYILGIAELDNVLGGGLVQGSSLLLGGEPGIGKSTLLLQVAQAFAKYGKTLYITGEESAQQVRMRAERLDVLSPEVFLLAETNLQLALDQARDMQPTLLIVDSVQAVFSEDLESAPGSVSQVRAVAAACLEFARETDAVVILVGHVTKEGMLAGPRVLEHMVDTVLYFEGDRYTSFRLLRSVKNRFGSTNEIGIFEMVEQGLMPYAQPSLFFLGQRPKGVAGSAVTCVMQGSRPMLLEVQALVAPTAFGNPRRLASGLDLNRLLLIIAVLERKLGLALGSQDIYLNIAGGLRVDDRAADLAVALAIFSSFREVPIDEDLVAMGELGLLGEIRSIGQAERRVKEALSFGFKQALLPKANQKKAVAEGVIFASDLNELLKVLKLGNN